LQNVAQQDSQEGDGFDAEVAQLPEMTGTSKKDAVLPNVLRNLVQRRRIVKSEIKNERDPVKLTQLDIR